MSTIRQTNTDRAWEYFGRHNPYWGVVTAEQYRGQDLAEAVKEAFFASGQQHVDELMTAIRTHIDPNFRVETALDFGCGVGRILIPLAKMCTSAVGVDISEAMLAEAKVNCLQQGIDNVTLVQSDDNLSELAQRFDFVHSYIVLQHIAPKRGYVIIRKLLELTTDTGVAALHLTYFDPASPRAQWRTKLYKHVPFLFRARNLLKGRPADEPLMQMNCYNLNKVLQLVQSAGFDRCSCHFTNHDFWGVFILCQRSKV